MDRIIIAVAIKDDKGKIWSMPAPARHHHVIKKMFDRGSQNFDPENQGFLTNTGKFVNRKEGFLIASKANQIKIKTGNIGDTTLYSEDLW